MSHPPARVRQVVRESSPLASAFADQIPFQALPEGEEISPTEKNILDRLEQITSTPEIVPADETPGGIGSLDGIARLLADTAVTVEELERTRIDDHGNLSGLTDDDHTQYHTNTRGDARYYTKSELMTLGKLDWQEYGRYLHYGNTRVFNPTADYHPATKKYVDDNAGETDHGALGGLEDDDHTQYVKNADSIDVVVDVDTTTDAPTLNECLKWDGANWVPAAYDYTFVFSIASFTDNEATTQLIGSGTWEAAGDITFDATYNNGPPTAATITMATNGGGGVWGTNPLVMDSPYAQKSTTEGTSYPTSKDTYIQFTLSADKGEENDTDTETVYFRNKIYWGKIAKANGLTEADVEGLAGSAISNDQTRSVAINAGAGEYLAFAFPASYTSIPVGTDYETDGNNGTGFRFNGMTCACAEDSTTLSITNSAGFTENYKVYVSTVANLGNSTLTTYTSTQELNKLYYGKTTTTSGYDEADVEGLANSEITDDNTQVWDAITTGENEYMLFAFPKRLGIPTFWVGGFEGGFEAPETVSVTNVNGWTEDYYVWRSTNSNLGETVVETK